MCRARDPRWGRLQETAGEDPVLVSEVGVAMVTGLSGRGAGVRAFGMLGNKPMLAAPAPKHFSCYCGPENWGGIYRWTFDAVVKDKYLTEYFHVGWEATIRTGLVRGPMCRSAPTYLVYRPACSRYCLPMLCILAAV